ncbi:hypothetical protein [Paenibacillus wynnii]|uniref:hypothetical protein n=1 Tax=Paenibacillus wynnii TaxID=268407 RepID=UPI0027903928|nr:hypothetical protein [Paenibacillus wynnii]MDQ0193644.1 hypothetical protein [Paenibacillus wynnii]
MSDTKMNKAQLHEEDSLITERDIDDEFGLFQEDSFPEALRDKDQKEARNHAILKEESESYEQPNGDRETGRPG